MAPTLIGYKNALPMVRWGTTGEYPLLYVFASFPVCIFGFTSMETKAHVDNEVILAEETDAYVNFIVVCRTMEN
jgi:hypothetical protein